MTQDIQDTLMQLFESVRHDPESLPVFPIDGWQEGSAEWRLLESFRGMVGQVHERMQQLMQTEERLLEQEELYHSAFDATHDGLFIGELDGTIVEVNPAACEMYGYTREEMMELTGFHLTHPDSHHQLEELMTKPPSQGTRLRLLAMRKDGTTFHSEGHVSTFVYKGKPHLLSVGHDVTENVEAEEQLREQEEQYRSVFEATYDGLIISSLGGFVVEVNPAFCSMYGYTRDELIGLHVGALAAPDSMPVLEEVLERRKTGMNYQTVVAQALHKDGTAFYVESHGTTFSYRGQPHTLGVVRDITERVEAEKQLHEKEEQYRSIFEASTDALMIGDLDKGYVVEANPAACQMYGYVYEEFIGLGPNDITPPAYWHLPGEARSIVKEGGQFQTQGAVALRKDGSTFYVDAHGTPFVYKGKLHQLAAVRDITERVEAERQLREREEQYRSIFESTYDGLAITTIDGFIVEVNPAFCRMFGYSYEEVIGLHASVLTGPASLPTLSDALEMFRAGKDTQTVVGQALRKDGTTFFTESYGTILTYQGKPHALSVVRDITERIQAEQQLREREEQYRSIFEATTDGLIIIDREDSRAVEMNPQACQMFGYTYEEALGLTVNLSDESQHPVMHARDVVSAGGFFQVWETATGKDGTAFDAEVRATPFTYKGSPHMLVVVRDVTQQVQAEKQLREREAQYRSVFEATYDALVVMDLDGYFIEVNPAFCNMFGYSREELIGKHGSITTAPETLLVLDDFLHTIKTGTNYQVPAGTRGVRKDGTVFDTESHSTTVTYQGKSHVLGVIRDITEQVQAQQLLEQRVEERTRELASLLSISHTVASTLQLKPLVGLILDQLKTVVDYTGAAILTVEGDDLVVLENRSPTPQEQLRQIRLLPQRLGPLWETIASGQSLLLPDMRDESTLAESLRAGIGGLMDTTFAYIRASLFVPLTLKDRVMGMLALTSSEADAFTQHHATLAQAVANQAAIAIENARLYAQAQELAALEERQKLARELHDSVSQALYGISLGAHAARTALEREPGEVAEPLDYVLSLAEAALAEMRALIFELRPESLETEGLVSALTKQAAATQARHELVVSTELCDEPDLSLHVKQELYRVAQEAMHNTVKHAHASQVILRLQQADGKTVLEVQDDGNGFDTSASFPGHLGLHSMRERVANLGGTFEIVCEMGAGTRICVSIPV